MKSIIKTSNNLLRTLPNARDHAFQVDRQSLATRLNYLSQVTCPNVPGVIETLQEAVCTEINSRFLGEIVEVLVEDQHKGKWRGRTRQNKLVFIESDLLLRGRLVEAQITWTGPWSMQGRFVRDTSPLADKVEAPKTTFPLNFALAAD